MMVSSTHPDHAGAPGRLNLLLSSAGWQESPWVERVPAMLTPMGVFSHIADSAASAQRVIESNPIHIAVVDLALPLDERDPTGEEAGTRVLNLLARLASPPPTVVIKRRRTSRDAVREMNAALRLGAFAVIDHPRAQRDIESLLDVLKRCMCRHYKDRWPGANNT
jgi:DNA-binding NtrC family response regulator